MDKVLILGASGLVGSALINELKNRFDLYGTYFSSLTSLSQDKQFQLDIGDIKRLKEIIELIKPDIVISCVRGEFEQQLKFHEVLARELLTINARMYYFSTTNVFDGDNTRPHTESDVPISNTDYGNFKIKCENLLKDILDERVVVVRIPAIWGKCSPRLKLIKESTVNNGVIDVYGNLVCNNLLDIHLAKQLLYIIENNLKGIFHLGSVDMISHSEFYEELISKLGIDNSLLNYHFVENQAESYYFALKTERNDIPGLLQCTNEEIISYLVS